MLELQHFTPHKKTKTVANKHVPGFKISQKCICGRIPALDPVGELTALPRPSSWIGGALRSGDRGKGMRREEEERKREGKGMRRRGDGEKGEGKEGVHTLILIFLEINH